jgi:cytidine deaminase
MKELQVKFTYTIYPDRTSLSVVDQELLAQAVLASKHAYAPYSKFKVGAAIRTNQHHIIVGSNQENGAFPIGQCAERVALYNMIHSVGRQPIDTMAIVVEHDHQQLPASPCGSCRQILCEYRKYQDIPMRLLLSLASGGVIYEIHDVPDILPFAFDGSFLGF